MNLFDSLQNTMFDTVTNTMGYMATWTATTEGSEEQIAQVLFSGPTEKEKIFKADYDPEKLVMEYKLGDFVGLKELADQNKPQPVNIIAIGLFKVKSVSLKADGKTFEANLQRAKIGEFSKAFNNNFKTG